MGAINENKSVSNSSCHSCRCLRKIVNCDFNGYKIIETEHFNISISVCFEKIFQGSFVYNLISIRKKVFAVSLFPYFSLV